MTDHEAKTIFRNSELFIKEKETQRYAEMFDHVNMTAAVQQALDRAAAADFGLLGAPAQRWLGIHYQDISHRVEWIETLYPCDL